MYNQEDQDFYDRRYGEPRTDEERAARHEELYPGEPLPERGQRISSYPWESLGIWPVVIPFTVFILWIMGKGRE